MDLSIGNKQKHTLLYDANKQAPLASYSLAYSHQLFTFSYSHPNQKYKYFH